MRAYLKNKIADGVLPVRRADGVERTSDYETSARETIRLVNFVSMPYMVSGFGNNVTVSFEKVINTLNAPISLQQIIDSIKDAVVGDAINVSFNGEAAANLVVHQIVSLDDLACGRGGWAYFFSHSPFLISSMKCPIPVPSASLWNLGFIL